MAYESIKEWIAFLKDNNLSHCNWAFNDKKEGASIFKNGVDSHGKWTEKDLTESGKLISDLIKNWNVEE